MNSKTQTVEQYAYIHYPREAVPRRGVLKDVRPLLPGDAEIFSKFPNSAYVLRDWKPIDDRNGLDAANLDDMWGVVIVFPNGRHVHTWHAVPLFGGKPHDFPADSAGHLAEAILAGDESLQEYRPRTGFAIAECVEIYGHKHDPRRIESAGRARRQGGY